MTLRAEVVEAGGIGRRFLLAEPSGSPSVIVLSLHGAQTRLVYPLRVVAFHGTADRLNPFAGSGTERWNESVPDAAAAWRVGLTGHVAFVR